MPLVLDIGCEVYPLLNHLPHSKFREFSEHRLIPDAVYVIGRIQLAKHKDLIRTIVETNVAKIIMGNCHEGSFTLRTHAESLEITDLLDQGKILLISGGAMEPGWQVLEHEHFLPKLFDYQENIEASQQSDAIYNLKNKPFKFMFLNGLSRSHRLFLLERWNNSKLLDQCIWTNLDSGPVPQKSLPKEYEHPKYRANHKFQNNEYVKHQLFGNDWGEGLLYPKPYIDTYFSVVTETVHNYPYSFRTEKIWKPIIMGHPWFASANYGFLRDMHNLGFRSFSHLVDESYDLIEDSWVRMHRFAETIEDLVKQDLPSFLDAARDVCKYNQQHYTELLPTIRKNFPNQFFQFLRDNQWAI